MNTIRKKLSHIPQMPVTLTPTPFHRLDHISRLTGCNIYIKRDDLTGFALSGNKTRKFDFLIAEAINQGCDTLIGIGANQSNFCRIAAGVGAKFGLDVHLVLNGKKPEIPTGNLRVNHILDAKIHHIDTKDSKERMNHALFIKDQLLTEGKKAYFMPPGGSTKTGTYGYALGFEEILSDAEKQHIEIHKIFHASSSAGTQAGLVLGQAITGWTGEIHGISVDTPQNQLVEDVFALASAAGHDIGVTIDKRKIFTDDSYVGEGYGKKTEGCVQAVKLFAKSEGIFLDYVYTGKAAVGLLDYCKTGKVKAGQNIVFLHTGGNIELFE
ncbi:MAG: D-cysteine desulfhydrase family protein [Candidatus Marinimicrobia bacterium]|nr:D-cysteine desulfhydrase family protein [Candidatus Neomarinimicrobiota bacterium]